MSCAYDLLLLFNSDSGAAPWEPHAVGWFLMALLAAVGGFLAVVLPYMAEDIADMVRHEGPWVWGLVALVAACVLASLGGTGWGALVLLGA